MTMSAEPGARAARETRREVEPGRHRRGYRLVRVAILFTTSAAALLASAAHGQAVPPGVVRGPDDGAVMVGESLAPGTIDPGIIEDMAAVIERERTSPPQPPGRIPAPYTRRGVWSVPGIKALGQARSGIFYLANQFGDTQMAIGFPGGARVHEVYILGQGGVGSWAAAVRVVGFQAGEAVVATDWFVRIDSTPIRLPINFPDVDRIMFEVRANGELGGWFGIDDLAFTPARGRRTILDFEDLTYGAAISGTEYGGLIWEFGSGNLAREDALPPPSVPPGMEDEDGAGGEEGDDGPAMLGGPQLPDMTLDFVSVKRGDAGQNSFPPDTCGAIGPTHYCTIVNRNFAIYNRSTGAQISNVSLGTFQPGTSGDPRVLYDHHAGRWAVVSTNFDTRIYVAYSLTNNPTGAWYKTNFIASQGSDAGKWVDYPTLGLDANGIYTAAYMVGGNNRMSLFAINKAGLLSGSPTLGDVQAFRELSWEGAIQPAMTWGEPPYEYLISRASSTQLRVRRLTWSGTTASLTTQGFVSVPSHSAPPDAPALGSSTNIDTGDWRLMSVAYRDGFLWTAHAINVSGRAAARWYRINASNLSRTYGTISDPSLHYYYPSIAVNAAGDAVIGFSGSNASQYVGAYFSGRRNADAPGTMAPPFQYRTGQGAMNMVDGFGRNRWGDYSLTTLDPVDESALWTIQAYGRTGNNWGTWVAKLEYDETEPPVIPPNDACADAIVITDGVYPFSTVNATTDGPDEPNACSFSGYTQIGGDIWYRYTAGCTGTAVLETCQSQFNTKLAVYVWTGQCPQLPNQNVIACNDDTCGQQSNRALVTFQAFEGLTYLVRLGGYQGATGEGTLSITCIPDPVPDPCTGDIDGNGEVDFADVLALLSAWGPCLGCDEDLDDNGEVDFSDLLLLLSAWGPCP
ncbi:MAG: hypothetical protein KF817_00635 [Phycisphaeraceae bacterium]|nr:hypothetical protein [Phycisphaeraceae bacterium]